MENFEKITLSEDEKSQKIELLNKLKEEINLANEAVKESTKHNKKTKTTTDLKIILKTLKLIYPYIIALGIITEIFKLSNATPFVKNNKKRYETTMTELDDTGILKQDKKYIKNNLRMGNLYYYEPWKEKDDGTYERTIYTYDIKNKKIKELLNKEDLTLKDLSWYEVEITTETKETLTESDNTDKAYIKAIVFEQNKKEYIIEQETNSENFLDTLIYVLAVIFLEVDVTVFRLFVFDYDYGAEINEIKQRYKVALQRNEELKRKLQLKNNNYRRLTRQ